MYYDAGMTNSIKKKPRYPTGLVANYLDIKPKTLINFENAGLTQVFKNSKNRRMYSQMDVLRVVLILHLLRKEGLNYKGCKMILRLVWEKDLDLGKLEQIVPKSQIQKMIKKAIDI